MCSWSGRRSLVGLLISKDGTIQEIARLLVMARILDLTFSLLAILVLLPFMLITALVLRLTGEGEVFFVQIRIGFKGKPFGLIKFATMLKDSPNIGTGEVTIKNDPRVLPLGSFLRKTKINELPQLFNILLGHMSIIGPRPQGQRCFDAFSANSQREIIKVRPGLSGIGSIIFRDEEKLMHASNDPEAFYDDVIMPYKGQLEEWYVNNNGLMTYFSCILVTIWILFFPQSSVAWRVFGKLPSPPEELTFPLGYSHV